MICPHCSTPLEQLGHMDGDEWVQENLWRCRECRYGKNRFEVMDGEITPVAVE